MFCSYCLLCFTMGIQYRGSNSDIDTRSWHCKKFFLLLYWLGCTAVKWGILFFIFNKATIKLHYCSFLYLFRKNLRVVDSSKKYMFYFFINCFDDKQFSSFSSEILFILINIIYENTVWFWDRKFKILIIFSYFIL